MLTLLDSDRRSIRAHIHFPEPLRAQIHFPEPFRLGSKLWVRLLSEELGTQKWKVLPKISISCLGFLLWFKLDFRTVFGFSYWSELGFKTNFKNGQKPETFKPAEVDERLF